MGSNRTLRLCLLSGFAAGDDARPCSVGVDPSFVRDERVGFEEPAESKE
jgi:hypothetical protein